MWWEDVLISILLLNVWWFPIKTQITDTCIYFPKELSFFNVWQCKAMIKVDTSEQDVMVIGAIYLWTTPIYIPLCRYVCTTSPISLLPYLCIRNIFSKVSIWVFSVTRFPQVNNCHQCTSMAVFKNLFSKTTGPNFTTCGMRHPYMNEAWIINFMIPRRKEF